MVEGLSFEFNSHPEYGPGKPLMQMCLCQQLVKGW